MALELLLVGPREIDGAGLNQLQNTTLYTLRPNPYVIVNLLQTEMKAVVADRRLLHVDLHQAMIQTVAKDNHALKAELYLAQMNTLVETEV